MKKTLKTAALATAIAFGAGAAAQAATLSASGALVGMYSPFTYTFTLDEASSVSVNASSSVIDPYFNIFDTTDFTNSIVSFNVGDESGTYTLAAGTYTLLVSSLSAITGTVDVALSTTPVPVPAALPLLATALAGAGFVARRKKKASQA
ncbi:VPLPA-CTERM sorting domain-containing protein [Thioclava sp. GXIMD4216]|uniref:VPLPA-CTERM sorting domain-containing protein n=1 Tax=Thioclava sp. GXIMD4216 TaxID=3131929 RepID=UPI0030CC0BA1